MAGMGTFAKKMQSRELGNSFDYTAAESVAMRALYSPPEASFLTAQMLGQGRRTVKNMFSIVFSFNLTKVLSCRIYPEQGTYLFSAVVNGSGKGSGIFFPF